MKITIVVGGRWHAFDLARELHECGHLHKLITNYPKWIVKKWGIPAQKTISLPLTFWIVKMIYKLGGEALMMRCQWWVHQWFANRAARYIAGSECIHAWSQWSEPTLEEARKKKYPDCVRKIFSTHPRAKQSIRSRTQASRPEMGKDTSKDRADGDKRV